MKHISTFIGLGLLVLSLVNAVSANADCTPPPAGLVSWLPAEGNANDVVNSTSGELMNDGVTYALGQVGTGFNLDGINGYVLVNPTNSAFDVGQGDGFTIEGWINPTTVSEQVIIVYYEKELGTTDGANEGLNFAIQGNQPGGGWLAANIVDTAQVSHEIITSSNALSAGTWQHIALTYDKISGLAALYVNGTNIVQANLGSFIPQTSFTNILFGAATYFGSESSPHNVFEGGMDEMSFYNRALSREEIQAIHDASTSGKCDGSGPFAPYIFAQPQGQTVAEGGSVTLSVTAGGTGPYSYQWCLNGTNITGATNGTLDLSNLHSWQSGNYSAKVTTPYGNVTSSNALVTVLGRLKLVYNYSGNEKTTGGSNEVSYAFSGQMIYFPDATNGVFIGSATLGGKKQYWVTYFSDYQLMQFTGKSKQVYTVLGKVGGVNEENGAPNLWSYFHKGANTILPIGTKKNFYFPASFSGNDFLIYPDPQIVHMILRESNSTYTYAAQATQTANNNGQTISDLLTAQIKTLQKQGYKPLAN